jgi:20S proteasome alpha/beta subunit
LIEYTPKLEKLKEYLDHLSVAEKECLHDLSYPFIPNFDPLFDFSKNKVLIVGQETKGWQGRLKDFLNDDISFENVIKKVKTAMLNYMDKQKIKVVFFNF